MKEFIVSEKWTDEEGSFIVLRANNNGTPTNNNDLVTKQYVDEAIANASLGGGSDVSDSGVIEDSEFDSLVGDIFGSDYIG